MPSKASSPFPALDAGQSSQIGAQVAALTPLREEAAVGLQPVLAHPLRPLQCCKVHGCFFGLG